MNRREFLGTALVGSTSAAAAPAPIPIVDTHIHLFDPRRPRGIPWPPKDNRVLYQPALPARYRRVTQGLGVIAAIEVECSPLPEDNQWVLGIEAKDPIMVGTIGDLDPGAPTFRKQLDELHRNPLFLGIRYGNLWGRDVSAALQRPATLASLKALAEAGLVMDTANPDLTLLANILQISDAVPALRIVVDHLPQMEPPADASGRRQYESALSELAKRKHIHFKVSEVLRHVNGRVPLDQAFYRARLDLFWDRFGEDRLLFGSDWPNSDLWAEYPRVLGLVKQYFATKSVSAQEKFFWKNSLQTYRWVKRNAAQKQLQPG